MIASMRAARAPSRRGERPRKRTRTIEPRDQGAVALEFALIAVFILLPLIFGMIEFGFMFEAQLTLTHAAREGARVAAVGGSNAEVAAAVLGQEYPGFVPAWSASVSGDEITIRVTHLYSPIFWTFLPDKQLTGVATMRSE